MSIYLDTNNKFYDWCEEHGYDPETEYDLEEEVFKRGSHVSSYIKKNDSETYANVTWFSSYDNGREEIEIQSEGLTRKEIQVTTTKIVYEAS